jgi:hypothetical protein
MPVYVLVDLAYIRILLAVSLRSTAHTLATHTFGREQLDTPTRS